MSNSEANSGVDDASRDKASQELKDKVKEKKAAKKNDAEEEEKDDQSVSGLINTGQKPKGNADEEEKKSDKVVSMHSDDDFYDEHFDASYKPDRVKKSEAKRLEAHGVAYKALPKDDLNKDLFGSFPEE